MKGLFLLLSCVFTLAWAQDDDYDTTDITDQQRCSEWAEMDSIEAAHLQDYMNECMASLGHITHEHEALEPAQNQDPFEDQIDAQAEDTYQDQGQFDEPYNQEQYNQEPYAEPLEEKP